MKNGREKFDLKARFSTEIILTIIIMLISIFSIVNLNTNKDYVRNVHLFNITIALLLLTLLLIDKKKNKT